MAKHKKKFTEGLENLFAEFDQRVKQAENPLLRPIYEPGGEKGGKDTPVYQPRIDMTDKDFSEALDALFQDVDLEEANDQEPIPHAASRGLDSLIKHTSESEKDAVEIEWGDPDHSMTLVLDREAYSKMQSISRQEGTSTRIIIHQVMREFIKSYEKKFGKLE